MYDKFEQLCMDAQVAVCILGNPPTRDFVLADLAPVSEDLRREYTARGMCFLGVIGIVEGVPRFALDAPLDPATTSALLQAFIRRIEDGLNDKLKPKDDFVNFAERLWSLEDPRALPPG